MSNQEELINERKRIVRHEWIIGLRKKGKKERKRALNKTNINQDDQFWDNNLYKSYR